MTKNDDGISLGSVIICSNKFLNSLKKRFIVVPSADSGDLYFTNILVANVE